MMLAFSLIVNGLEQKYYKRGITKRQFINKVKKATNLHSSAIRCYYKVILVRRRFNNKGEK